MKKTDFNPLLFYSEANWGELQTLEPAERNLRMKTYLFLRNHSIFINLFNELQKHDKTSFEYLMCLDMLLVSFRSIFLDFQKKNKNITYSNFSKEYFGYDISEQVTSFFNKQIILTNKITVSLEKLIKTIVDKFIVHYDMPTMKDIEIANIGKAYLITNDYIYVLLNELINIIRPATEPFIDSAIKDYLEKNT